MKAQRFVFFAFVIGIGLLAIIMALTSCSSNESIVEDWSEKYPEGQILNGYWPEEILKIEPQIHQEAVKAGLDPELYAALIMVESYGWQNCPDGPVTMSCKSTTGAIGPAQVNPHFHYGEGDDTKDLATNIRKGAEVLASYIEMGGSVRTGLQIYNCGTVSYSECAGYAEKVFAFLQSSGNKCHLMCFFS